KSRGRPRQSATRPVATPALRPPSTEQAFPRGPRVRARNTSRALPSVLRPASPGGDALGDVHELRTAVHHGVIAERDGHLARVDRLLAAFPRALLAEAGARVSLHHDRTILSNTRQLPG